MPSKNGSENSGNLRRSPRAPARVKVKFTDEIPEPTAQAQTGKASPLKEGDANKIHRKRGGRKRKAADVDNDDIVSPPSAEVPMNSPIEPSSPTPPSRKRNKLVDTFCWLCHKEADNEVCAVCPRVYHYQCLNPKKRFTEDGVCPECRLRSTDGTEHCVFLKHNMRTVLPKVIKRMLEKAPLFKTWRGNDEQNENLISIMDLSILQDRLNNMDRLYQSTAEFLADVKWVLHNCHIVYGSHDPLTNKARGLINDCRNELIDLEACPECYLRTHDLDTDSFACVCKESHTIVWAKIKGFPFWPAKVLKVIDSVASVRFFGSHDKGKVPVSHCYRMSEASPNEKMPKKGNFTAALSELQSYIENVVEKKGRFQYFEPKTKYDPGDANIITKSSKSVSAVKPAATNSKHGKVPDCSVIKEVTTMNTDNSQELIDITAEQDESFNDHSSECNEIEIIEQDCTKASFMDNLALSRANGSLVPVAIVNNQASYSGERCVVASHARMNNLEMEFCEDDNPETLPNFNHLFSGPCENSFEELPLSVEDNIKGVVNDLVMCVESDQSYPPSVQPSVYHAEPSSLQPDNQYSNSRTMRNGHCHAHRVVNDLNDVDVVFNDPNQEQPPQNTSGLSSTLAHYVNQIHTSLQAILQVVASETRRTYAENEKKIAELKLEIEKHKKSSYDIKVNTDMIVKSMRASLELEKKAAYDAAMVTVDQKVADAVGAVIAKENQKTTEKNQKIVQAEQEIAKAEQEIAEGLENYQNEKVKKEIMEKKLLEMEAKHQTELRELAENYKKGTERDVEIALQLARKKSIAKVKETKRIQWCAYCLNKANSFCCWNTSYCNEDCQSKDWARHAGDCDNKGGDFQATSRVAQKTESAHGGKKGKKTDHTNGQLPTLRQNGQKKKTQRLSNPGSTPPSSRQPNVSIPQKSHVTKHGNSSKPTAAPPTKKAARMPVVNNPKAAETKNAKDVVKTISSVHLKIKDVSGVE